MMTRFSLSALILAVLFLTNLSNRVLIKNIKESYTFSETSLTGFEADELVFIDCPHSAQKLLTTSEDNFIGLYISPHYIERNVQTNPSLNLLYQAHSPPFILNSSSLS